MAYPTQVAALARAFRERWPNTELTLHFHDTQGMGLANALAAVDAGASRFDASVPLRSCRRVSETMCWMGF